MAEQPADCGAVAIVAPQPPPLGGMALQAAALHRHLQAEAIPSMVIPTNPELPHRLAGLKGIRTVVQSLLYLSDLLRRLPRVSVVHILGASYFYFFSRVAPAVIIARILRKRVVLNYRGGAGPAFFARFGRAAWPIVKLAHLVTVPSAYLERCFAEREIPCRVVPNLIDLQRFGYRQRRPGTACILVNRNLEPMYNVAMALRVFAIVKDQFPEARLDVVGSGSQDRLLKEWVAERGLRGVIFHGAVAPERMPEFLAKADVLLNPTRVDNFPMSLVEAFASGLPVVSTNAGGIPDLVGESGAALLVEADDDSQMAREVGRILMDPALAVSLAKKGRAVAENFAWPSVKKHLLECYWPTPDSFWLGLRPEQGK